ncbi:putative E3 ubiquitin-protein ligase RBBP6 [Apostichopus japonicus]|uniref:Putative E3 ubiquitin-protein ligase RBBP6 n=1 Tax=Stichopus japonicus TaxID=307972 RepID=A0A2G8K657_STIJA|nr:putative E3 ubiquitin-protein ligase RBBP6 [Apostichopus japonicus]
MVFFTCNACGESLKKANVEKHYLTKCRACEVLSCLDCGKDFHGDAYKEHTSCISEDQKYGGKNFKATPHKGAVKQNSWIETVREASMNASLNPKVRNTMKNIINCGQANVPRKKAKFMNFVRNSMHVRETWLIEQVWDTIEKYAAAQRAESTQPSATNNGELHGEAKVDDGESKTAKRGDEEHKTTVEDINHRDKRAQGGGKRKRQGDPSDEVNGDGEDGLEEQPRKKKKKKKKNREDDDDGNHGEDEQTANGLTEEDVDAFQQQSKQNGISEELEGKKKRKGKKKREREVIGDEDESLKIKEVKGNQTENDCKSRKRKDKRNNDQSLKGKKSKKRKKGEKENGVEEAAVDKEEEEGAADDDVTEQSRRGGGKFKWEAVITEVLQQAGGEIRLKKLKKKVLSEYFAHGEDASITSEEKLFTKFNKKVMKNPKLKVHKEMVQLKH